MSLRGQLRELKAQQREELVNIGRAYARTKHDLDPKRLIRKYPAATLGAAAVAGMMIAPRPTPRYIMGAAPDGSGKRKRSRRRWGWMLTAMKYAFPAAAQYIPDLSASAPEAARAESGDAGESGSNGRGEAPGRESRPLDGLLEMAAAQAVTYLLTKIDVAAVVQAWVEGIRGKKSESAEVDGEKADDIGTPS